MKKFPHPQLCSFSTLFEKRRIIIPFSYQRNYKWKKAFWEKWLNDINKLTLPEFDRVEEIHFVGAVALKRNEKQKQPNLYIDHEVIDGQQRIITVFTLLLAILNSRRLRTKDNDIISDIRKALFLERKKDQEKTNKSRIIFSAKVTEEEDILSKIIAKNNLSSQDKKTRIWEAYEFFLNEIESGQVRDLDTIVGKIKDNLMFILIITDKKDDGREIFRIINTSKLDLSEAEKIKAFLSSCCEKQKFSDQKWIKTWQTLESNVGEDNLDHFFFTFLNIKDKKTGYTESKFFEYFEKWQKNENIKNLLDEIIKVSEIYNQIIKPTANFWGEDYYQSVIEINTLGKKVRSLYSFVILLRKHGKHDITAKILDKIVLYIFRKRFWSDRGVHWTEIDKWNEKVRKNQLELILQDPNIRKEIKNDVFWKKLEIMPVVPKEQNKYLLVRFYFSITPKGIFPNFSNLEIEHLFPETPVKEWFTIPQWGKLKQKEIQEKRNTIGNLTLLDKKQNIVVKNHLWSVKKIEVKEKTFLAMEKNQLDLFSKKDFLPEYIEARKKWLVSQFKEKELLFIDIENERKSLNQSKKKQ